MDKFAALSSLAALAQDTRLDVFRLLVQAGGAGMLAGEVAEALGVRQNTMSTNLAVLLNAGLVRKAREGRGIRYFADMDRMRGLLSYLLEDCCGGRPESCRPLLDSLATPGDPDDRDSPQPRLRHLP
ncbi:transcriptional regulator, ArsR family protein [Oceanicola granulosus HTCC2516]|uniref:Transcriptional regulator, ArsR family protein n=1 Tax=Oceanicola granulosus (strain ATCC BAA-861 / DSM 15982 / KCTC 12143 / HTCC2516) TaxID=314256 RepID=Q2CH91_OCEGH|nr:helix-turn-helix transcriptional regulator [Oceanicola granulosus]EAR51920.1 transcriptional regulator, ArsR family protein [Oceanicola granulosus HTCC2516]